MRHLLLLAIPLLALACGDLNGFPDASNYRDSGPGDGDGGGSGDGGGNGNGDGGLGDGGASSPIYIDYKATVFSGKPGDIQSIDGTGSEVRLFYPRHITKGRDGIFYLTEQQRDPLNSEATVRKTPNGGYPDGYYPGAIRQLTPSGTATFYLGKLSDFRAVSANPPNRRQNIDLRGIDTLSFSTQGNLFFSPYVGVSGVGPCLIYQYRPSTDDFVYIFGSGLNAQIPSTVPRDRDGCGAPTLPSSSAHEFRASAFAFDAGTEDLFIAEAELSTVRRVNLSPARFPKEDYGWESNLWAGVYGDRRIVDGSGNISSTSNPNDLRGTARFGSLGPIAFGPDGTLYIAETEGHVIRKINPGGIVSTVAGSVGQQGHIDGMGFEARFSFPRGIAVDSKNFIYVADWGNRAVRRISPSGVVRTLAGKRENVGTIDGVGETAGFRNPWGIYVDVDDALYVTDPSEGVVRKLVPAYE